MSDFVSIEILGTMAGCSLIITLLTQVFKRYLPEKIDTKWLALAFSIKLAYINYTKYPNYDFAGITAGIFNIFVLLSSSIGIYEIANPIATDVKTMFEGGNHSETKK